MKPRFRRRNRTRSADGSSSMFVPRTDSVPSERLSSPAMIEMSVVLPQPLGPTRKLSSPNRVSKSTPRSASTRASPEPKCLRTSRQDTAGPEVVASGIASPAEHGGRLEHEHAPDAEHAGHDDDEKDAGSRQRHALPHQDDAAGGQLVQEDLEEGRRHAGPQREAERPGRERLQENHADQA